VQPEPQSELPAERGRESSFGGVNQQAPMFPAQPRNMFWPVEAQLLRKLLLRPRFVGCESHVSAKFAYIQNDMLHPRGTDGGDVAAGL
jgi:hypothetical protein